MFDIKIKFPVIITHHPELNEYWGNFVDLDIVADGSSLDECKQNCKELLKSYIETAKEYGIEIQMPKFKVIFEDKHQTTIYIETEI